MNILVTNDDGIDSKGLWALAKAMNRVGRVTVIAPDKERNGVGSGLSLHNGINVNNTQSMIPGVSAYAVGGTPGDCVMLGINRLPAQGVDMVVSGINPGPNIGRDIHYSGTVMATLQGYFRKIPSIAVSLYPKTREEELNYDFASEIAEKFALNIANGVLKTDAILNINVPNLPQNDIKGIVTTRTADTGYVKLSGIVGESTVNYSLELDKLFNSGIAEGTDIWAIHSGYVSVSLLRFEVDHHEMSPSIAVCVQKIESEFFGKPHGVNK
ncbi:MAG TPA: 5'/3'-nucleotidase SurE [Dehalococcoidales bacterium]|jgi:5'-nucleotidase|nr:5'/3'-nucleotidase SurE [Dehalococcoidales bacterium]